MKRSDFWIWLFASLSAFLILLVLFTTFIFGIFIDNEDRGTFGDMFGAANALFTGLSFVGLIVTILLQREDLKETRNEMQLTREEFVFQNSTLKLQQFENTFFNLLNARNNIVSNIEISIEKNGLSKVYKGRDLITKIYSGLLSMNPSIKDYKIKYESLSKSYRELSLLNRNLFQIIKFVDEYSFQLETMKELAIKKNYVDILRDQLSDHEIAFLFYECILNESSLELKKYVMKYGLVDYVKDDLIFKPHKSFLNKTAP
ncbi:putative phage abortive infection protein [Chryseobacterium balustinum]|uniref:putative phage abortive infection protein n=1 Tax=Chryseobacterium balustinum TaxID=246 RepID=UPI003CF55F8E